MSKVAIIGGSGIYKFDSIEILEELNISTPFGATSTTIKKAKIEDSEFYFLPRHGEGHSISPSEINYRANIYALKTLGVDKIISISAVGSLKEEHAPGDFVLPSQFIDWTKGQRKRTFFEAGIVGHVSNAELVNTDLQTMACEELNKHEINVYQGGSYVCIEGPQFSSRAESNIYRSFN